ncbi:nucleotide exchange factor GrpE [Streptosporangium sp. NPDC004631]
MTDRRALLPLLLLAGPALTGCGAVAGGADGRAATAVTSPAPVRPGLADEEGVRPLRDDRGRGVAPGGAGAQDGFAPPGAPRVPLSLALALAAGALVVAGTGVHLWRRSRRTAPGAAVWPGAPGPPGSAPASYAPPQPPTPQPSMPTPPPPGPPAPGPPAASGPPGSGPPGPAEAGPLEDALAEVAGSGISQALTQQVERLFAQGRPERAALVESCIGCLDQIAERHPRLAGTLLDALHRAGVREIVADGRRFDPRLHEAFGTEPTARPELHGVVAETVKRGYADGDHVIRVPKVAVYRHESSGGGTAP